MRECICYEKWGKSVYSIVLIKSPTKPNLNLISNNNQFWKTFIQNHPLIMVHMAWLTSAFKDSLKSLFFWQQSRAPKLSIWKNTYFFNKLQNKYYFKSVTSVTLQMKFKNENNEFPTEPAPTHPCRFEWYFYQFWCFFSSVNGKKTEGYRSDEWKVASNIFILHHDVSNDENDLL